MNRLAAQGQMPNSSTSKKLNVDYAKLITTNQYTNQERSEREKSIELKKQNLLHQEK